MIKPAEPRKLDLGNRQVIVSSAECALAHYSNLVNTQTSPSCKGSSTRSQPSPDHPQLLPINSALTPELAHAPSCCKMNHCEYGALCRLEISRRALELMYSELRKNQLP